MRRSLARTVVLGILAVALAGAPAAAEELVQAFTLRETFGVSHPDQVIDFDLQKKVDPAVCVMLGPDGKEVPYQLIEDGRKAAVQTDLPAGAEKSWKLVSGRGPATYAEGVQVAQKGAAYEIIGGLAGVRVPLPCGAAEVKRDAIPAPVQGILLRDGTWTATGPNRIHLGGKLRRMSVHFVEKGPLKVVVEVAYEVDRPEVTYQRGRFASVDAAAGMVTLEPNNYLDRFRIPGRPVRFEVGGGENAATLPAPLAPRTIYYARPVGPNTFTFSEAPGGPALKLTSGFRGKPMVLGVVPAGAAVRKTTLTVEAGQPSILFEEETDVGAAYGFDLKDGLKLNQARYRGHHASSTRTGYDKAGAKYDGFKTPQQDAFFDFPFDRDYASSYVTDLGPSAIIRRVAVWDPWVYDSGWYWQAYDKDGGPESGLVGLFAGRPSRAVWPGNSGAGFYTKSKKSGGPAVGVSVQMNLGSPDALVYPRCRLQWGLFIGTRGKDLAAPDKVQPIARQMNLHAGVNLNKVHRLVLGFQDPPNGYGSPYMPRKAVETMVKKLRKDTLGKNGKGYYGYLYAADPYSRDLIDMWADASGAQMRTVMKGIGDEAASILGALVNEDGIYTFRCHYWHGGLAMSRKLLWIDQALGSGFASPEEKARVKAAAVLFGSILWDNDFVPMDNAEGLNLGTPNMPVQQSGFRNQYALFLSRHPMMQGRVDVAVRVTGQVLTSDVNQFGAHMACIHYVGAGMGPTLTMMQQLKTTGVRDFFKDEPRAAKFAEFYMNAATPREPRFGGGRKCIAIGDGSTEPSELYGQMATGFADVSPALSKRLMGLWLAQRKPHSSFHGTTLLKIDGDLPSASPGLGSANFPGQFSVLRHGWDTPSETAVWFLNGNFYWDHSHSDQGEVVIYALGAPVSIDWGPIYYPRVAGAIMHSVALPESTLGHPWDKDAPPLDAGNWGTYAGTRTAQDEFQVTPEGGWARASMTVRGGTYTWTRAVSLARLAEDLPVIAIQDSYAGQEATGAKVFTLNLMAEGEVDTPAGRMTPPPRVYGYESYFGDKKELASAGQVFALKPGVSRLGFTGQTWKAHPTQGIDWDVYVVAEKAQEAHIGNWAHAWGGPGAGEFRQANGRPFEERQHILRLRSYGGFQVFLVAYPKGRRPKDVGVKRDGKDVSVSAGGKTVRFRADGKCTGP